MLSEISIHPAPKALVPNLVLGCVSAGIAVEKQRISLARTGLRAGCSAPANSFAGIAAVKESKRLW
jgi:hypothetical protein